LENQAVGKCFFCAVDQFGGVEVYPNLSLSTLLVVIYTLVHREISVL